MREKTETMVPPGSEPRYKDLDAHKLTELIRSKAPALTDPGMKLVFSQFPHYVSV